MSKVGRAICYQFGALVLAIVLAIALSRHVPVGNFIEALQHRVVSWGAWAAIGYPLLFALCNILLLPGGIIAIGGGFFFGWWGGFLLVFRGTVGAPVFSFALAG